MVIAKAVRMENRRLLRSKGSVRVILGMNKWSKSDSGYGYFIFCVSSCEYSGFDDYLSQIEY